MRNQIAETVEGSHVLVIRDFPRHLEGIGAVMGLDKLRLISRRAPFPEFFERVNSIRQCPEDERPYHFRVSPTLAGSIERTTPMSLWTRAGVEPGFYLQLNYLAPGGSTPPQHILECNPNKIDQGFHGLQALVDGIFGDECDLDISRIDLNADIEGIPVEYFRQTVRLPRKRKSGDIGKMVETYSSCGVKTFYIGRHPARMRIYDKREELLHARQDLTGIPQVLTRVEWELRHKRCPVATFAELPGLLDLEPFREVQFLGTDSTAAIDPRSKNSRKLYDLQKRVDEFGFHEAVRRMNYPGRHFLREYQHLLIPDTKLRQRLQESYFDSTSRFFRNERADVLHIYASQKPPE